MTHPDKQATLATIRDYENLVAVALDVLTDKKGRCFDNPEFAQIKIVDDTVHLSSAEEEHGWYDDSWVTTNNQEFPLDWLLAALKKAE